MTAVKLPHDAMVVQSTVRMALTSGLGRATVANYLGIGVSTMDRWVQEAIDQSPHRETFRDLIHELESLRRENAHLRKAVSGRRART